MPAICRLQLVVIIDPNSLSLGWADGRTDVVDLGDWIRGGGAVLAPLVQPDVFCQARVGEYGGSVEWNDPELAIDAIHLACLADGL